MPAILIEQNGKQQRLEYPADFTRMPATQGIKLAKIIEARTEIKEGDSGAYIDNTAQYLQALTGADMATVRLIPTATANTIMETVEAMWQMQPRERNCFEIEGTKYLFPIGTNNYLDDTTLGQFADASDARANFEKLEGGQWEAILNCCAIYCRPVVEQYLQERVLKGWWIFKRWEMQETTKLVPQPYTNESYYERLELFKQNLTFQDLIDFAFFLTRQTQLSLDALRYLGTNVLRQQVEQLDELMDGLAESTN